MVILEHMILKLEKNFKLKNCETVHTKSKWQYVIAKGKDQIENNRCQKAEIKHLRYKEQLALPYLLPTLPCDKSSELFYAALGLNSY